MWGITLPPSCALRLLHACPVVVSPWMRCWPSWRAKKKWKSICFVRPGCVLYLQILSLKGKFFWNMSPALVRKDIPVSGLILCHQSVTLSGFRDLFLLQCEIFPRTTSSVPDVHHHLRRPAKWYSTTSWECNGTCCLHCHECCGYTDRYPRNANMSWESRSRLFFFLLWKPRLLDLDFFFCTH